MPMMMAASAAAVDEYGIPLVDEADAPIPIAVATASRTSTSLVRRVVSAFMGARRSNSNKGSKKSTSEEQDSDNSDGEGEEPTTPTKFRKAAYSNANATAKPKWWQGKTWTFSPDDDEAMRRTASTVSTLDAFSSRMDRASTMDSAPESLLMSPLSPRTKFVNGVPSAPVMAARTLADVGTSNNTGSALFELETVGEDAESLRDFCRHGDRARERLVERLVGEHDTDAAVALRFCVAVGEMEHMMGGLRAVRARKVAAKYTCANAPMHVVGVDVACPTVPSASATDATKEAARKAGLATAEALRIARDDVLRTLARNTLVMDFVRHHDARMARRMSGV